MNQLLARWAQKHDELTYDSRKVKQDDEPIVSERNGNAQIGFGEGGVGVELVDLDDDRLIIEGERIFHDPGNPDADVRGIVRQTGHFAIHPGNLKRFEIDGPLTYEE